MQVKFSKQALKFLNKQDAPTRKRLITAINVLPAGDVKKLQGIDAFRLRVGDYRIIFTKDGEIIFIEKIDNRGQVYR